MCRNVWLLQWKENSTSSEVARYIEIQVEEQKSSGRPLCEAPTKLPRVLLSKTLHFFLSYNTINDFFWES